MVVRRRREKRVLALASGGVAGLLYQVGVLEAFDDLAAPFRSTDFDMFLGVGSGAALAALLANGIPPREIGAAFEGRSRQLPRFDVRRMMRPNYGEILRHGTRLPRTLWHTLQDNIDVPTEMSLSDMALSLTGVLPSGLYVTDYLKDYLAKALGAPRADDFDALDSELYVVATDVDSGRSTVFGPGDGLDVSISHAVTATCAIPMLFAPVTIGGRKYVDGTMTKMLHLSLALDKGSTLNLCVTPIRPVNRPTQGIAGEGVVSVARQALRALLHSRLMAGLAQYSDRPAGVDIVLVQPGSEEGGALFFNVQKPRTRALLREAGYLQGQRDLQAQRALLDRHGVRIERRPPPTETSEKRLDHALESLEERLAAPPPTARSVARRPARTAKGAVARRVKR